MSTTVDADIQQLKKDVGLLAAVVAKIIDQWDAERMQSGTVRDHTEMEKHY